MREDLPGATEECYVRVLLKVTSTYATLAIEVENSKNDTLVKVGLSLTRTLGRAGLVDFTKIPRL